MGQTGFWDRTEQAVLSVTNGLQSTPSLLPPLALFAPTRSVSQGPPNLRCKYWLLTKRRPWCVAFAEGDSQGMWLSRAIAGSASMRSQVQFPEPTVLQKLDMLELAC